MSRDIILANLHLHAVLPRIQELVAFDTQAQQIAQKMNVAIRFNVLNGPHTTLTIKKGVANVSRAPHAAYDIGLLFTSCEKLNQMFLGEKITPIPYKGLLKLGQTKYLTELTDLLPKYLQPSLKDLEDETFKRYHVEMTLMVGLHGAAQLALHDPGVSKILKKMPSGSIQFQVQPDGPFAHVLAENHNITVKPGKISEPDGILEIKDVHIAADLLGNKLDSFAALGSGDIKAQGLLPLIDEFNALLDKVGLYLA